MCGIAGVISESPLSEDDHALLRALNGEMVHRGPDSDGFFFDEHVALSMRRLSIVDLASGRQPILSEDEDLAIVCNGEIYNHKDLRAKLLESGHRFRTHSDVETILHLYQENGQDCVSELRGMYAFAIWDKTKRELLIGRDRLGEKPLFLLRRRTNRGAAQVWFCSELSQLLRLLPHEARSLNAQEVSIYLTFQYGFEPATLVNGIDALPAATTLRLSPTALDQQPHTYWRLFDAPRPDSSNPREQVQALFQQACERMGSADVPVGVALSGGIDSCLVASVAAQAYPNQIHAFSVGYPGRPASDERAIARAHAEKLGLPFSEVEISTDDIVRDFEAMIKLMDLPIADPAAYGYYSVCRAARTAGIPVLLSGIGGDELFWGYDWVRTEIGRITNQPISSSVKRGLLDRLFGQAARANTDGFSPYAWHPGLTRDAERAYLMVGQNNNLDPSAWIKRTVVEADQQNDLAVLSVLDETWLRCNCLTLMDRMSMAHSIEMRVPFLDIDLTNAVTGMRRNGLDDWRQSGKHLLLDALGDLLPDQVKNRQKQGFTPPVQEWVIAIDRAYKPQRSQDYGLVRHGVTDERNIERALASGDPFFSYKSTLLDTWIRTVFDATPLRASA